jgi:hypothetical protein
VNKLNGPRELSAGWRGAVAYDPPPVPDAIEHLLNHVGRRRRAARMSRGLLVGSAMAVAIAFVGAVAPNALDGRWTLGLALAVVGVTTSAAWLTGRSTRLSVARHVDETCGLHELLSSAVATRGRTDDASRAVAAQAESVAARLSPGDVPVEQASPRAVAAVALAGVLSLVAWQFKSHTAAAGSNTMHAARQAEASAPEQDAPADALPNRQTKPSPAEPGAAQRRSIRPASPQAKSEQTEGEGAHDPVDAEGLAAGSTQDANEIGSARFTPSPATSAERAAPSAVGSAQAQSNGEADELDDGTAPSTALQSVAPEALPSSTGASPANASPLPEGTRVDVARIPARHRDIVRAFFDVPASLPSPSSKTPPADAARESDR